jgi:hypothetical protein
VRCSQLIQHSPTPAHELLSRRAVEAIKQNSRDWFQAVTEAALHTSEIANAFRRLDEQTIAAVVDELNLYSKLGANEGNLSRQSQDHARHRQSCILKLIADVATCCRISWKSIWNWPEQVMLHDATCSHKWFCSETPRPKKVVGHNLAQHELI